MHHQQLEVLDVVDEEGLVARGHHVAGLLVGAVADAGHGLAAAEATADAVVDTLGLSPAGVEALEAVGLVAVEARRAWEIVSFFAGLKQLFCFVIWDRRREVQHVQEVPCSNVDCVACRYTSSWNLSVRFVEFKRWRFDMASPAASTCFSFKQGTPRKNNNSLLPLRFPNDGITG